MAGYGIETPAEAEFEKMNSLLEHGVRYNVLSMTAWQKSSLGSHPNIHILYDFLFAQPF